MNKRMLIIFIVTVALVLGIIVVLFENSKNQDKNKSAAIVSSSAEQAFLFSDSVLTGMRKSYTGDTFVTYETRSGKVHEYYQEKLSKDGWRKIEDLGEEDMTECGGDWGGVYEKSEMKIKIHICGDEAEGISKDVSFTFYNIEPEKVLGNNFLGAGPNCAVDAEIKSIEACDTGSSIKFKLVMASDRINSFRANLGSYAWKEAYDIQNLKGNVEFEMLYEKGWEYHIENALVLPVVVSGNDHFDCSSAKKNVEITRCR
ncbi:MAG: hypothetical protein M0P97_01160 [Candidatus Moranbacteria bacterium]|nr:hypothetical protein [Candidatus Moranbacteria bacterium]